MKSPAVEAGGAASVIVIKPEKSELIGGWNFVQIELTVIDALNYDGKVRQTKDGDKFGKPRTLFFKAEYKGRGAWRYEDANPDYTSPTRPGSSKLSMHEPTSDIIKRYLSNLLNTKKPKGAAELDRDPSQAKSPEAKAAGPTVPRTPDPEPKPVARSTQAKAPPPVIQRNSPASAPASAVQRNGSPPAHVSAQKPMAAAPTPAPKPTQPPPATASKPTPAQQTPTKPIRITETRVIDIPVALIRPNRDQPRGFIDEGSIDDMAKSLLAEGQNEAIEVIEIAPGDIDPEYPDAKYELVKGERRWRGARKAGLPTLQALIRSRQEIPDKIAQHLHCLIGDHSHLGYDKRTLALAISYQRQKGGKTIAELATVFVKSDAWVSQNSSVTELHPTLFALLDPKLPRAQQGNFSILCRIAKLPKDRQIETYEKAMKADGTRLRLIEAKKLIAEIMPEKARQGRRRVPYDNVKVMLVSLPRVRADAITLNGYSNATFQSLTEHRSEEADRMLGHVQAAIENLRSVEAKLRAAGTANK